MESIIDKFMLIQEYSTGEEHHSYIRTTKSYLHLNLENLKAELKIKHPREKMKINNKIKNQEESK